MKVLVTGASGFLGSWVVESLLAAGHEVRALVRQSSARAHLEGVPGVELAFGSVEDAPAVQAATAGVEAVIHSAGLVKARNEDEFRRTNVDGTRHVARAAAETGVRRVVLVSSAEATGPSQGATPAPVTQETPVTAYGRSKLAAEKAALELKDRVELIVLRPGAIYGPRDKEIFQAFLSVNLGLVPLVAGGNALGSFIYAQDCAEACVAALGAPVPSGTVLHLEDGAPVSQRQLLGHIEKALGKRFVVRAPLPRWALLGFAHLQQAWGKLRNEVLVVTPEKANMLLLDWVSDASDARAALRWAPRVPLEEGITRTVAWYKQEGWL